MAKSNRTNRVRRTADSAEDQQETVGTEASDLPVEELDADEAGLDAHDLPGAESAPEGADPVADSGKTFPEKSVPAASETSGSAASEQDVDTASTTSDADEDDVESVTDPEAKTASPKKSSKADAASPKDSQAAEDSTTAQASASTTAAARNRKAAGSKTAGEKKSGKSSAKSGDPAKRAANRKTASYTSTPGTQTIKPNGRWFVPTMVTVLLLGLAWLVVFYVSSGAYPVGAWGYWNLAVGFAILVAGLVMSTRWR